MKKYTLLFILIIILIIVASLSFFTVREDEYACVIRFSKIIEIKDEAGIYFKVPFVDSFKTLPKHRMIYDINPSDVITKDKKSMIVDSYVIWRITDPLTYNKTVGLQKEAEGRLDALAYNFIKTKMGTLDQDDIINMDDPSERNEIYDEILRNVKKGAESYGIEVIDVKIKRFELPEQNEEAVYNRMISERNEKAQQYLADGKYQASIITNSVDKEYNTIISDDKLKAEQLRAEGESEYMKIIAEAYDSAEKLEFYNFYRSLKALEKSLDDDNKTIILDKDSPLARILLNNN